MLAGLRLCSHTAPTSAFQCWWRKMGEDRRRRWCMREDGKTLGGWLERPELSSVQRVKAAHISCVRCDTADGGVGKVDGEKLLCPHTETSWFCCDRVKNALRRARKLSVYGLVDPTRRDFPTIDCWRQSLAEVSDRLTAQKKFLKLYHTPVPVSKQALIKQKMLQRSQKCIKPRKKKKLYQRNNLQRLSQHFIVLLQSSFDLL